MPTESDESFPKNRKERPVGTVPSAEAIFAAFKKGLAGGMRWALNHWLRRNFDDGVLNHAARLLLGDAMPPLLGPDVPIPWREPARAAI